MSRWLLTGLGCSHPDWTGARHTACSLDLIEPLLAARGRIAERRLLCSYPTCLGSDLTFAARGVCSRHDHELSGRAVEKKKRMLS
jgi:hypothetical protein